MRRLVLVGGGHAHLSVLAALARARPPGLDPVLVTALPNQAYSGMLPGWMAGHYREAQCRIDLRRLARAAGVQLSLTRVVGMNAQRRRLELSDGGRLDYDTLSLDIGSEIDTSWLESAGDRLLPVKPLERFFEAWPKLLTAARAKPGYRLVVVGGGAAGVELALAARHAFGQGGIDDARVDLVTSEAGPLPGHAARVRRRMAIYLDKAGVAVHHLRAAGTENGVILSNGVFLPADRVIAATGARSPAWLQSSGLTLDESGYVAVDACQRSLSHGEVFAAGDICARLDRIVARSGVHAVRAGPVLAANLMATLTGGRMETYRPRRNPLYLLACGPRYAMSSWGNVCLEGRWVWRWKDWIDRRFIRRFSGQGSGQDAGSPEVPR
jgi:pyridine nucleotide-disulfide oxidoreductase family protein